MDNEQKMFLSALSALRNTMNLAKQDNILILTDIHSLSIANAFKNAGESIGCETEEYIINEPERPLSEIPAELANLLKNKTVVLNIIKALPEEISFRIKWILAIEKIKTIKCAHMPGINEDMMLIGAMNADYKVLIDNANKLLEHLQTAEAVHITTKEGTDVTLRVNNRPFLHDVLIKTGDICNLPCGEVYCAPEETYADGVVIFNASIGDIGLLNTPLKVYLSKGKIDRFECDDKELLMKIIELTDVDEGATIIGELGIGINPAARITGNMLEDEKSMGTAHLAFGNNTDFGGGKNNSKIHRDFLFYRPTIEVKHLDGSSDFLIKNGIFSN